MDFAENLFAVIVLCSLIRGIDGCGGYLKDASSGTIMSPNYPSNYPDESNCIWFIEAPKNYSLVLNITAGISGESNCDDFLRVTNGNTDLPDLYYGCVDTTEAIVYSNTRWLWVKFFSDDAINNTGFTATYSNLADPDSANAAATNPNYTTPAVGCQSVHFSCTNKECISAAYRCDQQQDCGCTGSGCDEDSCGGLSLDVNSRIAIGISMGIVIFTAIFVGIGALEIIIKRRSESDYQRKVKEARIRSRQKKNKGAQGDVKRQDSMSRPSTANPASRKNSSVVNPISRQNSTSIKVSEA